MPILARGYLEVPASIYGVSHDEYNPAGGFVKYPKRLGTFTSKNFISITNATTGALLYESGNLNAGGQIENNADGTIQINFNVNTNLGSSTDELKSVYALPKVMLSSSIVEAIAAQAQNEQTESLAALAESSNSSIGGNGFKIINDAMGTIVGNFSSVFVLQSGTRLSPACTTAGVSDSNLSIYTFEQGTVIPADWTAIKVTTGAVLAYLK